MNIAKMHKYLDDLPDGELPYKITEQRVLKVFCRVNALSLQDKLELGAAFADYLEHRADPDNDFPAAATLAYKIGFLAAIYADIRASRSSANRTCKNIKAYQSWLREHGLGDNIYAHWYFF